MKGGPCREEFIAWEGCVEAAEKAGESIVDRCVGPTEALKTCMEGNEGYYGVVLQAEAGMKAEAAAAAATVGEAVAVVEAAAGEGGVVEGKGVEGSKVEDSVENGDGGSEEVVVVVVGKEEAPEEAGKKAAE
ncbi:hypothetical protein CLOP_g13348 [Closterium sp. NIES-67]|nr:hypothetical protein CLOP_g13348 [Closterium sp. NIES-67]